MNTALIIIDMQMVMQERIDAGRQHVNPDAAENVAALVVAFRQTGKPVLHIRLEESDPASPLHADASGYVALVGRLGWIQNDTVFEIDKYSMPMGTGVAHVRACISPNRL